jgi:hypothetical protein
MMLVVCAACTSLAVPVRMILHLQDGKANGHAYDLRCLLSILST